MLGKVLWNSVYEKFFIIWAVLYIWLIFLMYLWLCAVNVISTCPSDVRVYFHIERWSEIQSQLPVDTQVWTDLLRAVHLCPHVNVRCKRPCWRTLKCSDARVFHLSCLFCNPCFWGVSRSKQCCQQTILIKGIVHPTVWEKMFTSSQFLQLRNKSNTIKYSVSALSRLCVSLLLWTQFYFKKKNFSIKVEKVTNYLETVSPVIYMS